MFLLCYYEIVVLCLILATNKRTKSITAKQKQNYKEGGKFGNTSITCRCIPTGIVICSPLKLYISKAIFQRHYRTTNLDLLRDLASQEGTAERVNKYTDIQIKFKLDNSYLWPWPTKPMYTTLLIFANSPQTFFSDCFVGIVWCSYCSLSTYFLTVTHVFCFLFFWLCKVQTNLNYIFHLFQETKTYSICFRLIWRMYFWKVPPPP